MNWIKSNPFVAALAGVTMLICGLLFFFASRSGAKYETARTEFEAASMQVKRFEASPLYPDETNLNAKKKALVDYTESINNLRNLFDKYRVEQFESISIPAFTERLKAANREASKALKDAGCEIPEGFYLGFENYTERQPQEKATGALDYQIEGVKYAMLKLAEARPSELIRVYREEVTEETGGSFKPDPDEVARKFGYEVTFKSSEAAAREFISSLGDTGPYYYVVRCIKVANERDTPPLVSDAKFESLRVAQEEAVEANPFAAFLTPNEEEEAPIEDAGEGGPEEVAPEGAPEELPSATVDSSRILAQVLGAEEVIVFVRFDLTMFLPSKELPKL